MTQDRKEAGSRPGWRGPGMSKTASKVSSKPKASKASIPNESKPPKSSVLEESRVPTELQQQILNIYRHTFSDLSERGADGVKPLLQEVKQALFERDFERAFGRQDYLEAYAFRWSPSRALCYLSIFVDLRDHFRDTMLLRSITNGGRFGTDDQIAEDAELKIFKPVIHAACLGGGAAEVVAFGGLLKYLIQASEPSIPETEVPSSTAEAPGSMTISEIEPPEKMRLLLIDAAAWDHVIHQLSTTLTTPPPLSKYASAPAKASNTPLLPAHALATTFQRSNLLSMTPSQLKESLGHHYHHHRPREPQQPPQLITLLFTLNELYTTSIPQTTSFLLNLTAATAAAKGALLLVVDSPGSYAEAAVGGKDKKKYPMQWLMDRTLLGDQGTVTAAAARGEEKEGTPLAEWEKLVADESRWFRMPEELKYPISLENMRYQIHLFRRL